MSNPISAKARGVLYLLGITIGGLAVVVGPLIVARRLNREVTAPTKDTITAAHTSGTPSATISGPTTTARPPIVIPNR